MVLNMFGRTRTMKEALVRHPYALNIITEREV